MAQARRRRRDNTGGGRTGNGPADTQSAGPWDSGGGEERADRGLCRHAGVGGRLFAFVGEAPVMKARLVTCEAEGRFRTEDIFETVVPMLKNAAQRDGFSF